MSKELLHILSAPCQEWLQVLDLRTTEQSDKPSTFSQTLQETKLSDCSKNWEHIVSHAAIKELGRGKEGVVYKVMPHPPESKSKGKKKDKKKVMSKCIEAFTVKKLLFKTSPKSKKKARHDDHNAPPYHEIRAQALTMTYCLPHCENFVRLFYYWNCSEDKEYVQYALMEFAQHGDLFHYLSSIKSAKIPDNVMVPVLFQILFGLLTAQTTMRLVHWDLHDENLLVCDWPFGSKVRYLCYTDQKAQNYYLPRGLLCKLYDYGFAYSDSLDLVRHDLTDFQKEVLGVSHRFDKSYDQVMIGAYLMHHFGTRFSASIKKFINKCMIQNPQVMQREYLNALPNDKHYPYSPWEALQDPLFTAYRTQPSDASKTNIRYYRPLSVVVRVNELADKFEHIVKISDDDVAAEEKEEPRPKKKAKRTTVAVRKSSRKRKT